MTVSHATIGWSLVIASIFLLAMVTRSVHARRVMLKRFVLDMILILIAGICAAILMVLLLLKFHRWGWEGIVVVPLMAALMTTPFLLAGLLAGERIFHQRLHFKYALLSLVVSTAIAAILAITFFELINGPDGGSTGGWELGFAALVILCPLVWAGLFTGAYLLMTPVNASVGDAFAAKSGEISN